MCICEQFSGYKIAIHEFIHSESTKLASSQDKIQIVEREGELLQMHKFMCVTYNWVDVHESSKSCPGTL